MVQIKVLATISMYLVPFESWLIVTLNHEDYRRQAQEEVKASKIATFLSNLSRYAIRQL